MATADPPDLPGSPGGESGGKSRNEDKVLGEKKMDQSWAVVAQDKKSLKKYDVEILEKGGKQTVEIPEEVITKSTPIWDDFLVGKFLDQAPHVAKVHMVLNKIWKYGDLAAKVEVYEVNETMMRFKVSNPKAREKIIRRGMWNIVGIPMIVSKWTPRSEEEKQEEDTIPMWINLTKVPLHMFSWEGLSLLASPVGFPVKLHPETLACTSFEVAKIFVKVDVTKDLPKEMSFTSRGEEFTVEFDYPWLLSKCKHCDKWGHSEKVCAMGKKGKEKEIAPDLKEDNVSKDGEEHKEESVGVSAGGVSVGVSAGVSVGEASPLRGEVQPERNKEVISDDIGDDWAKVPQGRIGRSQPSTPKQIGSEIHISSSKYSILSTNEEEEGEIVEEGKEIIEEEGNVDVIEEILEEDKIEDGLLEKSRGKNKVVGQRGRKKGQKAKARDENPGTKRSSRHQN